MEEQWHRAAGCSVQEPTSYHSTCETVSSSCKKRFRDDFTKHLGMHLKHLKQGAKVSWRWPSKLCLQTFACKWNLTALWMVQSGILLWQTLLLAMIHQPFTQKTWPPFSKTLQNILWRLIRFCQASWRHGSDYGVFRCASHWSHKHRWDSPQENEYLLVTGCYLKYMGDSSLSGFSSVPQYQM